MELAQETFLLGNAHNLEPVQDRHIGRIGECEALDVAENRLALLGHIVAPLVEHTHDVPPGANVRGTSGTRWERGTRWAKGRIPTGQGDPPFAVNGYFFMAQTTKQVPFLLALAQALSAADFVRWVE